VGLSSSTICCNRCPNFRLYRRNSRCSYLSGAAAYTITVNVNVNVGNVINGGGGIDTIAIGGSDGADVQSNVVSTANFDVITSFATTANDFDYNGLLSNGSGSSDSGIASTEIGSSTTLAAALAAAGAGNHVVFIATTDIAGASETALDALVAVATATTAAAAITAVVANTFNAVAGLDAVWHADIKTTSRYAHLSRERLNDAVNTVPQIDFVQK